MIEKSFDGKMKLPVLGAAYYPEDWDESEQDKDIATMRDAGISVVRMAEFSWRKMEPTQGEFHFEWLHKVIDKLTSSGIHVMLGTPTATPPIWLEEMEPDMMILDENGRRAQHGARRNNCSNNPVYREYSMRIVKKMAEEFGADPGVVSWQIDNEIITRGNGCFCEHCKKGFAAYLKTKYKTIDNLNRRWNLNLFSQCYDSFEQVPMPKSSVWHSPQIKFEWGQFQENSHINFIKEQADILHHYTKAPVGTDMMTTLGLDYEKVAKFTDIMQHNHYHDEKTLWQAAFWFDYIRSFKEIPFWNTETSTCWNGGRFTPSNLRPEGFCRANSWLPIILGGGANLYWLWRQHWAGHEQMHGSILYASGRPMHIFGEVKQVAAEFSTASEFLSDTRVVTDSAMMISSVNEMLFNCQQITSPEGEGGDRRQMLYSHITACGIRPDLISPSKNLDGYKLLFTPYMMTLEDGNLTKRIEEWVRNGGVWIAGPMTDIRDDIGTHYKKSETGMLEQLTGCKLVQQIPDHAHLNVCEWNDETEFRALHFLQLFEPGVDAEVLVRVKSGYSALVGKTLVFRKKVGKGAVYVWGALPERDDAKKLISMAITDSGAEMLNFTGSIVAAHRKGEHHDGIAAQEVSGNPGKILFNGEMTDILTGNVYSGEIGLSSYQTVILDKKIDGKNFI